MYLWLFASGLMSCQQVAPDGDPLQPVVIEVEDVKEEPTQEMEVAEDEEVFTISSEELAENANIDTTANAMAGDDIDSRSAVEPAAETASAEVAEAQVAQQAERTQPVPSNVPATSGWGDVIGKAWPVRLVTTVPNATPPRAILGLPDGREVVVHPGSMVPDMGLVVVAIAPGSAELARIAPAGDHATIETMTLRAQY